MRQQILQLGRNSVVYGMGTVVTRLLALLLLPLFTAYLTPEEYGLLALLAMFGQVVQPVFALGLGAGIGPCYFAGDSEQRKAGAVWSAFAILLLSSAVLSLAVLAFAEDVGRMLLGGEHRGHLVALSLAAIAINNLATPFTLRMQFENRATQFVAVTIATTVASTGASVLAVVVWKGGVAGMLLGQLAGQTVGTLLSIALVHRDLRFVRPQRDIARELLQLGLPLVPSFAFLFVILHANKYFLSLYAGLDAVGIYSVGFSIGMAIAVLVGAIQTAWYPYFMSYLDRQAEAPQLFGRVVTYYMFLVGGVALLFFIFARPVVRLLTHPSFYESYTVVGLVAGAQCLMGLFSLLLPPLYFAREVKYVSLVQGVGAVVLCVLSFVLIPSFSYVGAAAALFGSSLSLVVLLALWNRSRKDRYLQIPLDLRRIVPFAAFGTTLAVLLSLPYPFVWWQQAIVVPVSVALVGACVFLLLGSSERSALLELRLRRRVA